MLEVSGMARRSTRVVHERVNYLPTRALLAARLVAAGWRLSAGSWSEGSKHYVFSVEGAGPGTFGHSMAHLGFTEDWMNPGTGWISGAL